MWKERMQAKGRTVRHFSTKISFFAWDFFAHKYFQNEYSICWDVLVFHIVQMIILIIKKFARCKMYKDSWENGRWFHHPEIIMVNTLRCFLLFFPRYKYLQFPADLEIWMLCVHFCSFNNMMTIFLHN